MSMYMYLFEQSVNTLDKSKFEHRRGGGVETDGEDVGIAVVTSELSHQACDHHAQVSECGDEGQHTG